MTSIKEMIVNRLANGGLASAPDLYPSLPFNWFDLDKALNELVRDKVIERLVYCPILNCSDECIEFYYKLPSFFPNSEKQEKKIEHV